MNTEMIWASGLFEGEGCISLTGRCPMLVIKMTDKDVVERFVDAVGYGTIKEWRPKYDHWKTQYRWQVAKRSEVRRILLAFLPYLGKRRTEKALEALAIIA